MDPRNLSEADKHLIYGLLLKKKRFGSQERKVLAIVRSSMDLDSKIEAILRVTRARMLLDSVDGSQDAATGQAPAARRKRTMQNALVVDTRAEIAGLLKKCSLKRDLSFSRLAERYDAVHLITRLRTRLVIVNEILAAEEEYSRYFEICRAIEPGIRIIFLGLPGYTVQAGSAFEKSTRFLPKPLSLEKLEESARELLGLLREP